MIDEKDGPHNLRKERRLADHCHQSKIPDHQIGNFPGSENTAHSSFGGSFFRDVDDKRSENIVQTNLHSFF